MPCYPVPCWFHVIVYSEDATQCEMTELSNHPIQYATQRYNRSSGITRLPPISTLRTLFQGDVLQHLGLHPSCIGVGLSLIPNRSWNSAWKMCAGGQPKPAQESTRRQRASRALVRLTPPSSSSRAAGVHHKFRSPWQRYSSRAFGMTSSRPTHVVRIPSRGNAKLHNVH